MKKIGNYKLQDGDEKKILAKVHATLERESIEKKDLKIVEGEFDFTKIDEDKPIKAILCADVGRAPSFYEAHAVADQSTVLYIYRAAIHDAIKRHRNKKPYVATKRNQLTDSARMRQAESSVDAMNEEKKARIKKIEALEKKNKELLKGDDTKITKERDALKKEVETLKSLAVECAKVTKALEDELEELKSAPEKADDKAPEETKPTNK